MYTNYSCRYRFTASSIVLCLLWLLSTTAYARDCNSLLFTGNSEYPPMLWRNERNPDQLTGITAEILHNALQSDQTRVFTENSGPWSRAQKQAQKGRVVGLAGAFLTEKRQAHYDYIYPPIMSIPSVIFVKSDSSLELTQWDQLKPLSGVTLINNSFGQNFDNYAKEHLNISKVHTVTLAFKMLIAGRSDYLIYELQPGLAYGEAMGISQEIKPLKQQISSENLYFALSKSSACNTPELRDKLAEYLRNNLTQERIELLTSKYLELWKLQTKH